MSKKMTAIEVQGIAINFVKIQQKDFICITDIAKFKNPDAPRDIIKNWIRNKNTIELLGLWEKLHNPDFKQVEFDLFKNEAGFINDNLEQSQRLERLNSIEISQMKILISKTALKT
jgi:hypothetical protein